MPPILRNPRLNQLPVFFAPFTVASFASTALSAASSPTASAFDPATFAPSTVLSAASSVLSAASAPTFFAPETVLSAASSPTLFALPAASSVLSAASWPAFFAPFLVALAAFFAPDFVLSPTSSALSPTSCPTFFVVSTVLSTAFSASCFTPLSCRATASVLIPATNANANSADKNNFDITPALPFCNEIKHFPLCPGERATPVPYQRLPHHSPSPT